MRRILIGLLAVFLVVVVLLSAFVLRHQLSLYHSDYPSDPQSPVDGFAEDQPFYVGVTYCGNSTVEAKLLIDRVKNYTNLFVLQSGQMEYNVTAVNEVCDYAASSGLYIIVYFGALEYHSTVINSLLQGIVSDHALQGNVSWHNKLVGVYFGDEPGGKMLDTIVRLHDPKTGETVTKISGSSSAVERTDGTTVFYRESSSISVDSRDNSITYYANGTIFLHVGIRSPNATYYVLEKDGTIYSADRFGNKTTKVDSIPNLPKLESYETLMAERPFQNYDDAAQRLVNDCKDYNDWLHNHYILKSITSDYGLYWWDNLGGYDSVLAQLGWNNTVAQEIALARGAANLQGKNWGTIITWKYTTTPYLASGGEIYDQMVTSYKAGAKYILIFNYAEDMQDPYGTMQDDHFNALERFWKDVVKNPNIMRSSVKAEAALVLPKNYGWGMRNVNDTIWGLWKPDDKSQQVWTTLKDSLEKYGSKLDIVFDDPEYPITGKYAQIIYWNQTS